MDCVGRGDFGTDRGLCGERRLWVPCCVVLYCSVSSSSVLFCGVWFFLVLCGAVLCHVPCALCLVSCVLCLLSSVLCLVSYFVLCALCFVYCVFCVLLVSCVFSVVSRVVCVALT